MKLLKKSIKSKTMNWGHIQVIAGAIATGLALVNPATIPDLPAWSYGVASIIAGVITYILRANTRKPVEEL